MRNSTFVSYLSLWQQVNACYGEELRLLDGSLPSKNDKKWSLPEGNNGSNTDFCGEFDENPFNRVKANREI